MSTIEVEVTQDEISLWDKEEDNAYIALTRTQFDALVEYVRSKPTDTHGWVNSIKEDGIVATNNGCPCHGLS